MSDATFTNVTIRCDTTQDSSVVSSLEAVMRKMATERR